MVSISEKLRTEFGEADAKRDFGLTTPAGVRRYDDISYGQDPLFNRLDVYRPAHLGKETPIPVIMIVHGGGWVYGTKETYQYYGMGLAERGFAVVNFSYRLAPEAKFPAQLEDICQVAGWILKHAAEYGLDTKRLFAVGDSAGAHLLGLLCAMMTDETYKGQFSFSVPEGFTIRAIGMNCGAYEIFRGDESEATQLNMELMHELLPEHGSEKEQLLVNVPALVNGGFPPAFVMSCVGDFLMDHVDCLEQAYVDANVPYRKEIYGSETHPLYHDFHVNVREDEGRRCNDDECAFFQSYC